MKVRAKKGTGVGTNHHEIPNALADLAPRYLADTHALVCPICRRTGEKSPVGVLDNQICTSYLFEFAPVPMPAVIKASFPGTDLTMRQWKFQQMEVAGKKVPMVRCFLHLRTAIHLSYGGEVYESPQPWLLGNGRSISKQNEAVIIPVFVPTF